ncbi:MAG: Holliday junction resolvase RuvX [Arenicellales bacterium]
MAKAYLAFDYGTKRIGLAIGNDLTRSSQPLSAIATKQVVNAQNEITLTTLQPIIETWRVKHLVFGLPLGSEGEETPLSKRIRKLGNRLSAKLAMPVSFADERYSSGEADRLMREHQQPGKRFKTKDILLRDSVAAQLILDVYFSEMG